MEKIIDMFPQDMPFAEKLKKRLKANQLALKNIKIKNSDKCEECGAKYKFGYRLVRHHSDYNKPLDIKLLCDKCHIEWHKLNKTIN